MTITSTRSVTRSMAALLAGILAVGTPAASANAATGHHHARAKSTAAVTLTISRHVHKRATIVHPGQRAVIVLPAALHHRSRNITIEQRRDTPGSPWIPVARTRTSRAHLTLPTTIGRYQLRAQSATTVKVRVKVRVKAGTKAGAKASGRAGRKASGTRLVTRTHITTLGSVRIAVSRTPTATTTTPRQLTAVSSLETISLHWTRPALNGGSRIKRYIVSYRPEGRAGWSSRTAHAAHTALTHLDPPGRYQIRIQAVNSAGRSWPSRTVNAIYGTLPAAPDGLSAQTTTSSIDATWDADTTTWPHVTGYHVTVRPEGSDQAVYTHDVTGTSAHIDGLQAVTAYQISVSATNAYGTSTPSSISATTIDTTQPTTRAPELTADAGSTPGVIEATWTDVSGTNPDIIGYRLQYRPQGTDAWTDQLQSGTTSTLTGLPAGTLYELRVAARTIDVDGPWSDTVSVTTQALPGEVGDLTAAPGDSQIRLTWDKPANAGTKPLTGYRVSWQGSDSLWHTANILNADTTDYIITGLDNGHDYLIRVHTRTSVGLSTDGSQTSATPGTAPAAAPQLTFTPSAVQTLNAAWSSVTAAPEVTSYQLQYRPDGDSAWTDAAVTSGALQRAIPNLTLGATYQARVRAINTFGNGPWSVISTSIAATTPGAVGNLAVTPGDGQLSITWDKPSSDGHSPLTGYRAAYYGPDGWNTLEQNIDNADTTSITFTGLTNGRAYTVLVWAYNQIGAGQTLDQPITTLTGAAPLDAPQLGVIASGDKALAATWTATTAAPAVTGYHLQYRAQGDSTWTDTTIPAGTLTASISALAAGTTYQVRVCGANTFGCSPWSDIVTGMPATLPGPVGSLLAAPADRQIHLAWTKPADTGYGTLTGYRITWKSSSSATSQQQISSVDTLDYTITGLVNGTSYTITIWSTNQIGETTSSTGTTSTPAALPASVGNLRAAPAGAGTLAVSWTSAGPDVTSYHVQYRVTGSSTWTDRSAASSPLILTGLSNSTSYDVRIAAGNPAGQGPWSTPVSVSTATLPGPVTELVATPGDGQIDLTWNKPFDDGHSPLTGYRVAYYGPGGWSTSTQNIFNPNQTSYTLTGLVNGYSYDIVVYTYNAVGASTSAGQTYATPNAPGNNAPSVAPQLSVIANDVATLDAQWTDVTGSDPSVTGYHLQYRPTGGNYWTDKATTSGYLHQAITGLSIGTSYDLRISATNSAGDGPWSTSSSGTAAGYPDAASNVHLSAADRQITVTWTKPANDGYSPITGYRVAYYDPATGWSTLDQNIFDPAATSFTITGLTNGTSYQVKVWAYNAIGSGDGTNPAYATPKAAPSVAPSLSVAADSQNTLTAHWNDISTIDASVTGYHLQFRPVGRPSWSDQATASGTLEQAISSLTAGSSYDIRVSATNSVGDGPWSDIITGKAAAMAWAVENLSAAPGDGQINITWSTPLSDGGSAITGYTVRLLWDENGDWQSAEYPVGDPSVTSYLATGLTNGTSYNINVWAINQLGGGWVPDPIDVIPGAAPSVAAQPTLHADTDQALDAQWADLSGVDPSITGYRLQYRASGDSTWTDQAVTAGALHQTISNLVPGTSYDVRVSATNSFGDGPWSPISTGTAATYPDAISNLVTTVDSSQIAVTWTKPANDGYSPITGYRVAHYDPTTGWTTFHDILDPAATSYTVTGLTNGVSYLVKVWAYNQIGFGTPTDISATPQTAPAAPGYAPQLTMQINDWQALDAHWNDVSTLDASVTGYHLQYRAQGDSVWIDKATTPGYLHQPISSLTAGTTYEVRVSATNSVGDGPWSDIATGTAAVTPSAVQNVQTNSYNSEEITVSWDAPASDGYSPITGYRVAYYEPGVGWSTFDQNIFDPTATSYTITGLQNSHTYMIVVFPYNQLGAGDSSGIIYGTPNPAVIPN